MKKTSIIFLCLLSASAFGQLNNQAFEQRMAVQQADSNKLFLGINLLGFGKNNEYFDTTIDGYTLLGYQINPYLSYHIAKNVRLDAGVYAQKDIGNDEYSAVKPTLSLKITQRNFNFIFGTLEGSLNHRLIEPLYDFERVLNNRLENGVQLLWMKDDLFLDVWVDWQNMIYFKDTEQERFVAGASFNKTLFKRGSFHIDLPVQWVTSHQGGQIDINNGPVITQMNSALGLVIEKKQTGFVNGFGVKAYAVDHRTSSDLIAFNDGYGFYVNPYVTTKIGLTVMGSYWKGNEFLTIQGGTLYPSITDQYPNRVDEVRDFIMLRFLYDLKIADGLNLSVRAEPFYDTYAKALEYSYGFYLSYSNRFFLADAKKNR